MKQWAINGLLWLSCFLNWAFFMGRYNQTTSSRIGMEMAIRGVYRFPLEWKYPGFVFWLLWPILNFTDRNHCREAWQSDKRYCVTITDKTSL